MGGSESKSDLEGFQIASIVPNSPAHEAGLVPFFDFICGVDNTRILRENSGQFREIVANSIHREIKLHVYNTKTKAFRDVPITPDNNWGGLGLLGCSINWENVDQAQEYVWHVTGVLPGSPAAKAGLQAGPDYLIGMQTVSEDPSRPLHMSMFNDSGDFHARIEMKMEQRENPHYTGTHGRDQLLLLVYDSVDNSIREVMMDLWGKTLGLDVARGYLHVIPVTQGDTRIPVIRQFYIPPATSQPPHPAPAHPPTHTLPPPPASHPHPAHQPLSSRVPPPEAPQHSAPTSLPPMPTLPVEPRQVHEKEQASAVQPPMSVAPPVRTP